MTTPTGQPQPDPATPVAAGTLPTSPPAPSSTTTSSDAVSTYAPAQSNRLFDIANLKDDGSNFPMWKFRMEMILESRRLWSIVNKTEPCPSLAVQGQSAVNAWKERDHLAKLQISLTLDDSPLSSVMLARTSAEAWDKLLSRYEGKGKQTIATLIGELFRGTLSDQDSLETQLDAMQLKARLLEQLGQPLDDSLVAIAMVTSLPASYSTLRTILMSTYDTLSTDTVVSQVLNEERSRKEHNGTQSAFLARTSNTKGASKSTKAKPTSKAKKTKCAHCSKLGHTKEECRKLKAEQASAAIAKEVKDKTGDLTAKVATVQTGDETIRLFVANALNNQSRQTQWLVDSGASSPMSSQRDWFVSFKTLPTPKRVWLGDERYIHATGIGRVSLRLERGPDTEAAIIPDVYYVPDLNGNLLSVSHFVRRGYSVNFEQGGCSIVDASGSRIATASEREGLYILHATSIVAEEHAFVTSMDLFGPADRSPTSVLDPGPSPDVYALVANASRKSRADATTWHRRLGHISFDSVFKMVRSGMVKGMDIVGSLTRPKTPCSPCLLGKQSRDAIAKQTSAEYPRVNYRTHADLQGPMQTATPGGHKYLSLVVEGKTRHLHGDLLRLKSDQTAALKDYIARSEVVTGETFNILRTDNGGETVMEMARTMLQSSGLPNTYWGEACLYAIHIINRTPSRALGDDITPHEAFTGNKPSVAHIRPFGCKAFVHIPDEKRQKLDPKSLECVLVGWSASKRAYRLLHRSSGRIYESRDVVFDEGQPDELPHRVTVNVDPIPAPQAAPSPREQPARPTITVTVEDVADEGEAAFQPQTSTTTARSEPAAASVPQDDRSASPPPPPAPAPPLRRSTRVRRPALRDDDPRFKVSSYNRRRPAAPSQEAAPAVEGRNLEVDDDDDDADEAEVAEVLGPAGDEHANRAEALEDDPQTYEEAMSRPDADMWKAACAEELLAFAKAEPYDEVERPQNRKVVGCKWVFRLKRGADGSVERYKARLVAQGFTQVEGIDYSEMFAPVSKFASIRTVLTLAALFDLEIDQMDVKSAFLNGDLDEEIFMAPPQGSSCPDGHVWRLRKALYGLRQASREWYKKIRAEFESLGFVRSDADHSIFTKVEDGVLLIIALYVDDMLLVGNSRLAIDALKAALQTRFEMTDLGAARWILGMEIKRDRARHCERPCPDNNTI
ncbi:hypothetical protein BN946_scf184818.g2 [Trametes cinnabarina]|uniref:Integrase catalytic domain-containing protein n=1 Tax=Pycnoporus cinnabarinus TaxID=5643 RepID=A0A060SUY4_PYCCI|nr:hypothetical protein BN946_scf184818.g2 [Trametes cinnabarina]